MIIVTVVEEREVGLALGAADYLVKPIQREALLRCLARIGLSVEGRSEPVRILVVDDDAAVLDAIEGVLAPAGFAVIRATGGDAGVAAARSTGRTS